MSQGIPVVGTATGGTPEIVANGRNGLLYDGTSSDLAAKIERVASDHVLFRSLSEQALATAKERFTVERYVSEVHAVLEHVLRHSRRTSVGRETNVSPVPARVPAPKADPFLNPPFDPNNCDLYW